MQTLLDRIPTWAVLLTAVPLLLLVAGCDSDDPDPGNGDGGGGSGGGTTVAVNYDTSSTDGVQTITIEESDNEEGIVPVGEDGTPIDDESEVTWTSDYEYVLEGRVFVNDGQTLTIEAGTVIRGVTDLDPSRSAALIVAQGGTIDAVGTASDPIIFTAVGDPSPGGENFTAFDRRPGFWGGVIILGRASNNASGDGPSVLNVEGIPTQVSRARYGCGAQGIQCNDDESSGTFQYVSIRYGGTNIGEGNEINGLTMGSVGAGTTIDHVEIVSNQDDGFEWFGGTVNATHLVSTFVGDDSFDIDQGYNGSLQYLLAVQGFGGGERGAEHDSGDSSFGSAGEGATPVAQPTICNATYIGADVGDIALKLRDNFGGQYYNSIFAGFPNGLIEIEDLAGTEVDSRGQYEQGNLRIENNIAFGFDGESFEEVIQLTTNDDGEIVDESFRGPLAGYLSDNNRLNVDPGVSASFDDMSVDVVPDAGGPASTGAADAGTCLNDANYIGAFEPGGTNWAEGWTVLSQAGFF